MIVVNYFLAGLIWVISVMPFFILYGISDFLFLIIYYVIGYRKKVVFANLRNSFPDKSEKEIKKIAHKYFHNLCDLIIEVSKGKNITEKSLQHRMKSNDIGLLNKLYAENKSVLLVCGHSGNWEWLGMILKSYIKHEGFAVVKPLTSNFWEKYLTKLRLRFAKDGLVPFKQTFRVLVKNKDHCTLTLIAGDQTPTKSEIEYWTTFLNQDTAVFLGTEKIAKALNMAVVFCNIQRVKRGWYNFDLSLLTDDPKNTAEFEITEMHVSALEKAIIEHPDNWLWSHRRWKHKRF